MEGSGQRHLRLPKGLSTTRGSWKLLYDPQFAPANSPLAYSRFFLPPKLNLNLNQPPHLTCSAQDIQVMESTMGYGGHPRKFKKKIKPRTWNLLECVTLSQKSVALKPKEREDCRRPKGTSETYNQMQCVDPFNPDSNNPTFKTTLR